MTQILQQLNLTLQSIHLLQRKSESNPHYQYFICNYKINVLYHKIHVVSDVFLTDVRLFFSHSPCWFLDSRDQRAPAWRPARGPCLRHSRGRPPRMPRAPGAFLVASWLAPAVLQKQNTRWWKPTINSFLLLSPQRQTDPLWYTDWSKH